MLPFGMIEPGVQPLAPLLALGQVLEEQAARDVAPVGPLRDADADQARDLLGLDEIALRRLGQRVAVERDDALIALARRRQVEGDRQIALAEQREQRRLGRRLGQPIGIVMRHSRAPRRRDSRTPAGRRRRASVRVCMVSCPPASFSVEPISAVSVSASASSRSIAGG